MTYFGIVGLFSLSFVLGLTVIFAARKFNVGADPTSGVQRFHTHWAPRLGGVAIYVSLALWILLVVDEIQPDFQRALLWVLCLTPAFLVGLLEDLTQKIGSWPRLMTTMFGAALAWWLLDAQIVRLGLPPLDAWLAVTPIASLLITMLFVGGAAHAINMVDGYNGLASSYVLAVMLAILVVAGHVQDIKLMYTTVGAITATLGFFVLNFPSGRIFLGDSGAYLLGTVVAFLLTILVARNPEVSPMFAAVLLVYPVWELLFSTYRRRVLLGTPAMQPDANHLHTLIYKRLVRSNSAKLTARRQILMNSATTLYVLTPITATAALALTFWNQTQALFVVFVLFIVAYLAGYTALVRFRVPRALAMRTAWAREQPAASWTTAPDLKTIADAAGPNNISHEHVPARVLHVGKFYPPVRGGLEAVTHVLVRGLGRRGVRADVLCFNTSMRTAIEESPAGRITRAGTLFTLFSQPISLAYLWHFIRHVREYDLIHLHLPNPILTLVMLFVPRRTPVVVHWHSDIVRQKLLATLVGPLVEYVLKRAAAIVATSQRYLDGSETLKRHRDKVRVIPIGIWPVHAPEEEEVRRLRKDIGARHVIFSLGRLTYYKGFEHLIDAAQYLPEGYAIVIGGAGRLEHELRARIAALGVEKRVTMAGDLTQEDLALYFSACDAFCLPSVERSEAFGVVLLEAMSMGKPIVATEIVGSGVSWVNQHGVTGINVPVRDAHALAGALRQVCEDQDLRRTFSANARARFKRHFAAEIFVDNSLALYSNLVGRTLGTELAPDASHGSTIPVVRALEPMPATSAKASRSAA